MNQSRKDSLLWGLVGGLAFLVMVQGYELLTEWALAASLKVGIAVVVAAIAAEATHLLRPHLLARLE